MTALGLVARLAAACRALRRLEAEGDEEGWSEAKLEAEAVRSELREAVRPLREPGYLQELGRKAEKARKRRQRLQRRKQEAEAAKEEEAARAAEREAEIDRWRAKCIQEVEEKNRVRPRAAVPSHPMGAAPASNQPSASRLLLAQEVQQHSQPLVASGEALLDVSAVPQPYPSPEGAVK